MASEPLVIPEAGNLAIGHSLPEAIGIEVSCECGNKLTLGPLNGWEMNIVGLIQFRCPCGKMFNSQGLWET